jgi:ribonuclease HI
VKKNPSPFGGTWAWVLTEDGKVLDKDSGKLFPNGGKPTSNNFSELFAATEALEAMPDNFFGGILYTDSRITLLRLTTSNSFKGIPDWLRIRTLDLRRNRKWKVVLVAGHPTKIELKQGFRKRNGLPTSKWNQWCDRECTRLAKGFRCTQQQ